MANIQKQAATSNWSDPVRSDAFSGAANAVVSGTGRRFFVPDLVSALSIKAVLAGSAAWETESRKYAVRENSYLVVNRGQRYSFIIESATLTTTFSLFFQHGFVEEVHRVLTQPDSTLLDSPETALSGSLIFRQRLEPEPSGVLAALRSLHDAQARGQLSRTATEEAFLRIARTLVR